MPVSWCFPSLAKENGEECVLVMCSLVPCHFCFVFFSFLFLSQTVTRLKQELHDERTSFEQQVKKKIA